MHRKELDMESTKDKLVFTAIVLGGVSAISYMIHMGSDVTRQAYYSDWYLNLVQNAYQIPM